MCMCVSHVHLPLQYYNDNTLSSTNSHRFNCVIYFCALLSPSKLPLTTCGTLEYKAVFLIALVMDSVIWVGATAMMASMVVTVLMSPVQEIFVIWMKSLINRLVGKMKPPLHP